MSVLIELVREMFGATERLIASTHQIEVYGFRYSSGVEALRVRTDRAELIVLPFKGQQIWRAIFGGQDITMGSMFPEPRDTTNYLETYGAFLIHCGMTAMGVPGPDDSHPLHGELPNAPMDKASILFDQDKIEILSEYRYTKAFTTDYTARPKITLRAGESLIDVRLEVSNERKSPIELMYLAHANFRPVDHGELIYSAQYTSESVRVRQSIPSHISPPEGYRDLIEQFASDPASHHTLSPDLAFDPEMVFQIDAIGDENGQFHALQRHPDGTSDFISYNPKQAPITMRWICRTPDQQGLGIAFPATAGVEGYTIEKAKGLVIELPGGENWGLGMRMGRLNKGETEKMAAHIGEVTRQSQS